MEELILFIMSYIFIFIFYQIVVVTPAKNRKKKKKKSDKEVAEIKYLIFKYGLDIDKVNYNQLLQICGLTTSFDVSLTVSIIALINNFALQLLVGVISIVLLIFISYHIVYLFYKKKGMIKNEF